MPLSSFPEGYEIAEMVWKGAPNSDAANITLNGTIEIVVTHLTAMNLLPAAPPVQNVSQSDIERRDPRYVSCALPNGIFPALKSLLGHHPVEDGIKHLMHASGKCGIGPRQCVRVSCSWYAGIHVCNDLDHHVDLDCSYLGDVMVRNIYESCTGAIVTGGYCYENDRYTVYVALNKC